MNLKFKEGEPVTVKIWGRDRHGKIVKYNGNGLYLIKLEHNIQYVTNGEGLTNVPTRLIKTTISYKVDLL